MAARAALRLRPRRTVQTVCSTPASFEGAGRILFADHVVVLSRYTRQRFIDHGIDPQRLRVIPPGIRLPATPSSDSRIQARESFGIPRDHSVVLYPGDYQFSRAAQTFAEAIPHLADLPITFIMACRIKQAESKQIERRIRAMLIDRGVIDRVQMHNEVSDMIELLTACDLCLLPAESTFAKMDLPLVLIEAMALGVPLVVSDRPPLSEILEDPAAGLAVPPEDPEALAAAVRELLTNPNRLGRAREAAQRIARERFEITSVSRRYEELYVELVKCAEMHSTERRRRP
jgi:glycosyltransferase involved in cell wall biosynthesis